MLNANLIDQTNVDFQIKNILLYIFNKNKKNIILFIEPKNDITYSIQKLIKLACCTEREIFEFFGIFFNNALDLRRLLTDYSLIGHPLKKMFPLTGFVDSLYSIQKRICFRPIVLTQEFRNFLY